MQGIRDRVAIVGAGCTKFGERWDAGLEDLMVESAYEAFEDAGLSPQDIQAAWLGINYQSYGGLRGSLLAHALKLQYIPVTRVENACATATEALRNACYAVAAGIYDIVMAVGVEKMKDCGWSGLPVSGPLASTWVEPEAPAPVQFALAATRYFHKYGLLPEEGKRTLAKIAVKNHHNGSMNPKAHFQREITVEQAMNAPMVATPLGLFDCCGVSDGSAAVIVTTPEIAKTLRDDYILVKGLGVSVGAKQALLNDWYDYTSFEETVTAGKYAYEEAGIKNPRDEVDLAVVHDCFSITEMIIYEDLQFSPKGKAKEDVDSDFFTLEGGLPVNTDGGLKCFGHPIGASGLRMVYEVYKQLQGKAGPRQVKNARIGLTHNLGGHPGHFACAISLLGQRD